MSDTPRLIKKYPNRRLYDTANSGYITLADVKLMVLENIDFQVIDAKSGDDLTRAILLQIILEEESGGLPMFSAEMLAQMIRFYGTAQQTMMGAYMEEIAGAGETDLRRQDDDHARPLEAVHADAGPGDAGDARQLPRAERQAVHGHAAAHAGSDTRHVLGLSVSQFRCPAANRG
jgi:polyhydroxyalkanoate synthesis repressor PhaR